MNAYDLKESDANEIRGIKMNKSILKNRLAVCMFCVSALTAGAATHYLAPANPSAANPYTSWETAGTSIIDVVKAAMTNATTPRIILVTNGVYTLTNATTAITNDVVIRSVNGRDVTVFNGNGLWRCFDLQYTNCMLDGLTISNGYTSSGGGGGGIYIKNGIVTNCLVTDCVNSNTFGRDGGGGIRITAVGVVANCVVRRNKKYNGDCAGGGIAMDNTSTSLIENCVIEGNQTSGGSGGGIVVGYDNNYGTPLTTIRNCLIRNNTAQITSGSYGGGIMLGSSVTNRLLIANCTILSNTGRWVGGIASLVGSTMITNPLIFNCIVVSNQGSDYANFGGVGTNAVAYSCSTLGTHFKLMNGNTTNDPKFTGFSEGNYRFNRFSPCFNSGTNQAWMTNAVDLDGHARILHGRVDMGAYELFIPSGTMFMVR